MSRVCSPGGESGTASRWSCTTPGSSDKLAQTLLEMVRGGVQRAARGPRGVLRDRPAARSRVPATLPFTVREVGPLADGAEDAAPAAQPDGWRLRVRPVVRIVRHVQRRGHPVADLASDRTARRGLGQPAPVGARHRGVVPAEVSEARCAGRRQLRRQPRLEPRVPAALRPLCLGHAVGRARDPHRGRAGGAGHADTQGRQPVPALGFAAPQGRDVRGARPLLLAVARPGPPDDDSRRRPRGRHDSVAPPEARGATSCRRSPEREPGAGSGSRASTPTTRRRRTDAGAAACRPCRSSFLPTTRSASSARCSSRSAPFRSTISASSREVIVVDDCSKDATSEIVSGVAGRAAPPASRQQRQRRGGACGHRARDRRLPDHPGCRSRVRPAGLRADDARDPRTARRCRLWQPLSRARPPCQSVTDRLSRRTEPQPRDVGDDRATTSPTR